MINAAVSDGFAGWNHLILIGCAIIMLVLDNFLDGYLQTRLSVKIRADIRGAVFRRLLLLPEAYHALNYLNLP